MSDFDIPELPELTSEPTYYKGSSMQCVEVAPNDFFVTQIDAVHDFSKPDPDSDETGFDVEVLGVGVFGTINMVEKWIQWGIRVFGCTLQKVRIGADGGRIGFKNAFGTAEVRLYRKGDELRAGVNVKSFFFDKGGDYFITRVGSNKTPNSGLGLHENTKYTIVNVATGTAIDLSGTDRNSVSGWSVHGGENQQWTLESHNSSWRIRSVDSGRYLVPSQSFENTNDGTKIVSSDEPADWNIYKDDSLKEAYRIFLPNFHRPLNIDMAGSDSAHGTPIVLWGMSDGKNQMWYFRQV